MVKPANDPFDLDRFVRAQEASYAQALAELRAGRKRSHWIWYILPQMRGLGSSPTSAHFAITGLAEAKAYLEHPVLGARLRECVGAICAHTGLSASEILGELDAQKFRSCLSLFAQLADSGSVFHGALKQFFSGRPDPATLVLLRNQQGESGEA